MVAGSLTTRLWPRPVVLNRRAPGHRRAQESEADVLGQRYMAAAGFDPQAAVTLWQNMEKASPGGRVPAFLATHPAPGDRIAQLSARVPALEPAYRTAHSSGREPHCSP